MKDNKEKKPDVFQDAHDDDPEFQAELLAAQKKLIKETNPGLHSVFEKYKNFHKAESDKKED